MATYACLCLIIFSQFISILAQSSTYIVHMDLDAMPKVFSGHHNWYDTVLSSIQNDGQISTISTAPNTPNKLLYSYSNAMHGFSARISPLELKAIENSPGFVSAFPDKKATMDTSHSYEFLGLNDVFGAWPVSNYGEGIIIGVVDTGVWPESESYHDAGMSEIPSRWKGECENGTAFNSSMCNKKLIGAKSFNKGRISEDPTWEIQMNSARDTDGHGTHTSSIAAGNYVKGASFFGYATGTIRGMAPKAHLAMYKSIWNHGNGSSDTIAAIDQAISDGVDVISLSQGFGGWDPLYEDPIAIASFAAMEKGIFFATSAGNRGHNYARLHNGTPWILTVGAGTIDREFTGALRLGNGHAVTGLTLYPGKSYSTQFPLVFMNTCSNSEEIEKVGRKIVVCLAIEYLLTSQVGTLGFVKNIVGGIFITNMSSLNADIKTPFRAVFLSPRDGQVILDYIKESSNPTASFEFKNKTRFGTKPAPSVADYSSRGPSTACPNVLKPDLIAPGSLILASSPPNVQVTSLGSRQLYSHFNILSGTSMACPHAAGIAALIKGAHPNWSPAAIRSAMMTTSYVLDNTRTPIKDIDTGFQRADPLSMGAGHVSPNKALDPGLIYDINSNDYVRLLCAMNYTMKQIQTITRSSRFNCSNASSDLNYPSFIAYYFETNSSGTVQEFRRTVTNVGDALSTYTATLTQMNGYRMKVVPDTLSFTKKYQKRSYKLFVENAGVIDRVVDGALSWADAGGRHVVRSPIVATPYGWDRL